ncbi:MAG: glycosyltransferase [Candidatus Krumholzibacteriia bacterium]
MADGRKRVLMIGDGLAGGGAERQLALLAGALSSTWDVAVHVLGDGVFAERLREAGVPLEVSPRSWRLDPLPTLRLWAAIRRLRPHVVHSWGWMSCFAAEPCCRLLGIPQVSGVIRRGNLPHRRSLPLRLASRLGVLTVANSRAGLVAFGVDPERGRVLPNGLAPDRLARAEACRPAPGGCHVVMAATMDARKDFGTLVAAARILARRRPGEVRVTAIGGGPDLERWRREAADLVASGAMAFPGRVDEVIEHAHDATVGVMLSTAIHAEGLSNSIMEFMACGLPVICTAGGGNPELVVEGETGFLVPVGDVEAVVARLEWLVAHPAEAAAMGEAGRRRLTTEFSLSRMVERAVRIYDEALARAGRGHPIRASAPPRR